MDVEPSRRWHILKLRLLWRWPQESRKKIKKFLKLGDEYGSRGEQYLADYCYDLSRSLAREAGAVHLMKQIDERSQA